MKIMIVCSRLCFGGAERVAVLWANGFVERGYDVVFISNLFEEKTYHLHEGISLHNLVSTDKNKIKKWGSALLNVRKLAKKEQPNIIIGVMETCSLISKIATIGTKIPVIMTEHNSFERPDSAPMTKIAYLFKYYVNRIYEHVTVLTTADKLCIGDRLKCISIMPNPLALQSIKSIVHREKRLLAVGRLDGWHVKGFDVLIKSFAKLLNGSRVAELRSKFKSNDIAFKIREEGWKLQIAGTGSEESLNYLKQLCKENGVEDYVEFLGFTKDVEKLYQESSIFVLSSRYEGFGLVLIEAMSQGCACVACDYKGRQREIIAPLKKREQGSKFKVQSSNCKFEACETGILCEPDNVDALAEAMAKMITDDEYRESVRKYAIERSENYSIENTMNRWEQLLNQIK